MQTSTKVLKVVVQYSGVGLNGSLLRVVLKGTHESYQQSFLKSLLHREGFIMETELNGWNSFVKRSDFSAKIEYIEAESVFCHIHSNKSRSETPGDTCALKIIYVAENGCAILENATQQVHIITFRRCSGGIS